MAFSVPDTVAVPSRPLKLEDAHVRLAHVRRPRARIAGVGANIMIAAAAFLVLPCVSAGDAAAADTAVAFQISISHNGVQVASTFSVPLARRCVSAIRVPC